MKREMLLRRWETAFLVLTCVAMPIRSSLGQSTTGPTDAANQANVRVVQVVVGMNFVTINGRQTPAEQLQTTLEAIDDRADAVLQLGYASDDVTIGWYSKVQEQIFNETERKKLGFRSYSNVGLQPAIFPERWVTRDRRSFLLTLSRSNGRTPTAIPGGSTPATPPP
jgi:hypothetical protein